MIDRVMYLIEVYKEKKDIRNLIFDDLINSIFIYDSKIESKMDTHPSNGKTYGFDKNGDWYFEFRYVSQEDQIIVSDKMYYIFNTLLKMEEKECRSFFENAFSKKFQLEKKYVILFYHSLFFASYHKLDIFWKEVYSRIKNGEIVKRTKK